MSLEESLDRLAAAVERLTDRMFPRPERPGVLTVRTTAERQTLIGGLTVDLLSFVLIVPAAEDKDVVNRKLTVTLPDGSVQTADVPGSEVAESAEFEVPQDATVNAVCVNVDDAGNESEPRVQDLVIRDTFAPKAPGEIGVRVVSERTVEDTPPSE